MPLECLYFLFSFCFGFFLVLEPFGVESWLEIIIHAQQPCEMWVLVWVGACYLSLHTTNLGVILFTSWIYCRDERRRKRFNGNLSANKQLGTFYKIVYDRAKPRYHCDAILCHFQHNLLFDFRCFFSQSNERIDRVCDSSTNRHFPQSISLSLRIPLPTYASRNAMQSEMVPLVINDSNLLCKMCVVFFFWCCCSGSVWKCFSIHISHCVCLHLCVSGWSWVH